MPVTETDAWRRVPQLVHRHSRAVVRVPWPVEGPGRKVCLQCMSRVCEHMVRPHMLRPGLVNILALLVRGLSNKEIAQASGLTVSTVKQYMSELFRVTGFTSRLEVGLWAAKNANSMGIENNGSI